VDSESNSSPTTSTSTALTTKNLNVSGNSGLTAVGGENGTLALNYSPTTTVISTDAGAVGAATGLASHALDVVAAVNNRSNDAIANLATKQLTSTENIFGTSLTAVTHESDNAVSVVSKLATQFGTALADYQSAEQAQLGNVVSALNSTYTANNTSANQQVINAVTQAGQTSASVIKYVAVAALAAALLFVVLRK
jgi:hypothetical protein